MVLFAPHNVLQGSAVLAARSGLVPQRADLPRIAPRSSASLEMFHFALRPRRAAVPGLVGVGGGGCRPVPGRRQEAPPVPAPAGRAAGLCAACRRERSGPRGRSGPDDADVVVPFDAAPGLMPERAPRRPSDAAHPERASQVHLRLIERYSPPSLVVDQFELMHVAARRPLPPLRRRRAEPELMRIAHPMLRIELRAALNRVAQTGKPTEVLGLPIDLDGQALLIDLSVGAEPTRSRRSACWSSSTSGWHRPGGRRCGTAAGVERLRQPRERALRRGRAAQDAAARRRRAAPGVDRGAAGQQRGAAGDERGPALGRARSSRRDARRRSRSTRS